MPRYINELNECTDPVAGDQLLIYDNSAPSNDKERRLNVGRLARADASNTFAANQAVEGLVSAQHFRSTSVTIAQNNAVAITPNQTLGLILIATNFFPDTSGIAVYRAASSPFCAIMGGGANFEVTTGVLAGTTGNNGKITVSAHTDGKIYIEQRRGAEISLRITFLS